AVNTAAQGNFQAQMAMAYLPILGFNNIKGFGGTGALATDEYESDSRMLLYVEQPTTGLLNFFIFPSAEQAPPAWVSEKVAGYATFNWDAQTAYQAVETLVDGIQGPGTTPRMLD